MLFFASKNRLFSFSPAVGNKGFYILHLYFIANFIIYKYGRMESENTFGVILAQLIQWTLIAFPLFFFPLPLFLLLLGILSIF